MKHLVVGYGNMGRRHAGILRAFGDHVDSIDLEWEPGKTDYEPYDSILVCTPPKTHLNAILDTFSPKYVPKALFVEKPLITQLWWPGAYGSGMPTVYTSMVACNWRYCQCVDASQGFIEMGYPADQETAYLDMIHFLDLFWLSHGEPEFGGVGHCDRGRKVEMTVSVAGRMLNVIFDPTSTKPYMRHNGKTVHRNGPCSMFERQMRDWRECVRYGVPHLNSFAVAAERTNWLIERWAKNQVLVPEPM